MRLAIAVVAAVQLVLATRSAGAVSGLLNTRLDTGIDWYLGRPPSDAPVYPGFQAALSADGRLFPRVHFLVGGTIDSYRYGEAQTRSQLFGVRSGVMFLPIDHGGGTGFLEATAGWARLHGNDCMTVASGLGYLAQYGRLGIGLFTRYTQVMVPAPWGDDVKSLSFGVAAGVVLVEPRRPPAGPAEPPSDADGDGVEDAKDRCAGTSKGAKIDQDGCEVKPAAVALDKPPAEPEAPSKPAPAEPLAEVPPPAPPAIADDDDDDGVLNEQDQCRGTTRGFPVDPVTGCPVLRARFALPQVTFVPFTVRIKKEAYAQLDELLLLLRDRPGVRLQITSYAASAPDMPVRVLKRLAGHRAQVVRELLIARGLGAKRIKAKGSDRPDVDEIEIALSGSTKQVVAKGRQAAVAPAPPMTPPPPSPALAPPPMATPAAVTPPVAPIDPGARKTSDKDAKAGVEPKEPAAPPAGAKK